MKKKTRSIIFTFLALATALFVACYKEAETECTEEYSSMTYEEEITAARELYESMRAVKTRGIDPNLKSEASIIAHMEPMWGKEFAFRRKNKKRRTVESVMYGSKRCIFMLPEVHAKYRITRDARYKQSMSRLVVETNTKTGQQYVFIMTIMPSVEYLEKTKFKPFYNTYLTRDKNFSGAILYHELDGQFANGWRYQNGKITHSIDVAALPILSDEQKRLTRATHEVCETMGYFELVETCRAYCTKTEFQDVCEEEQCSQEWELLYTWQECRLVEDPEKDDPPGGYIPPINPNIPLAPILETLFTKNEIGTDISKLETVIGNMLEICVYNEMYKYMQENEFKFSSVKYDRNMGGSAGITKQGDLKFLSRDNINLETVSHEFFHMFQCAVASNWDSTTKYANIVANEFERCFFNDIAFCIEHKANYGGTYHTWANAGGKNEENYIKFIEELTRYGAEYPNSIPIDKYRQCMTIFWETNIPYNISKGLPCEPQNYSPVALNDLFSLANSACINK